MKKEIKVMEEMLKLVEPHIKDMFFSLGGRADVTIIFTSRGQKGCAIFSSDAKGVTQDYLIERLKENKDTSNITAEHLVKLDRCSHGVLYRDMCWDCDPNTGVDR